MKNIKHINLKDSCNKNQYEYKIDDGTIVRLKPFITKIILFNDEK